jgi:hypothetical protein
MTVWLSGHGRAGGEMSGTLRIHRPSWGAPGGRALAAVATCLLAATPARAVPWSEVPIDTGFSGDDKAVADIDLDGKADVIGGTSTGNSTDSLRWWRQSSPTVWTPYVIVSGGAHNFTTEMQVGDMDNDGDVDLVVFDMEGNHLGYYRNPRSAGGNPTLAGEWGFVDLGSITSNVAHNIFIGDVDADGALDIFIKGQYGGTGDAEIWIQDSPTSFTPTSLAGSSGGEGNCMGDLDNDGDLDLVTAMGSSPFSRWYENDGGLWTAHDGPDTVNGDLALRVAEITGDGRNDLVVSPSEPYASPCGDVSFFSTADPVNGPWTGKTVHSVSSCTWHTVQVGDIDRDGRMDIMSAQMHGAVMAFFNPGGDAMGTWNSDEVSTAGMHTGVLADVDGNGALDIVGSNYDGDSPVGMRYFRNGSPPLAADQWTYLELASDAQSNGNFQNFGFAQADIDRDGDLDVISGGAWWRNPGGDMTGAWERVTITPSQICVAALDVDGDPFADVVALSTDGTAVFWHEATATDGSTWTERRSIGALPPTTEGSYGGSQGQRVADVERGGRLELLVGTSDGSGGAGAGIYYFVVPAEPASDAWPRKRAVAASQDESFALGDIDRDGDLDVVYYAWATSQGGNLRWGRNPGDGAVDWPSSEVLDLSAAGWCWSSRLELADLDRDGRLDVVAGGECDETLWVRQPDDPTTAPWAAAATATLWSPTGGSHTLDVGDLDADGDPDIFVAEHLGDTAVRIFLNDGTGTFSAFRELYTGGGRDNHIGGLADMDVDYDLDIVDLSWTPGDIIHLWRNDANRTLPACAIGADCTTPPACRTATGATCPAGACIYPALGDGTACTDDADPCTTDACQAGACTHVAVTACIDADGCCPSGCDRTSDDDCTSLCGNGVVEGGETCDGNCPTACDDGSACTTDVLQGAACTRTCSNDPVTACVGLDGCCPVGCDSGSDSDCSTTCGNGTVELGETCDGDCPTTCDDADLCTTDSMGGSAATCSVVCGRLQISVCTSGDGCCPTGCGLAVDVDCTGAQPPPPGGAGTLEGGCRCGGAARVAAWLVALFGALARPRGRIRCSA